MNTPEKNYPRVNERTICIRNADCLLNQILLTCFCHAAKIDNLFNYICILVIRNILQTIKSVNHEIQQRKIISNRLR